MLHREAVPAAVVVGLDHGHGSPMGVLPLGCHARVDPAARTIEVVEPAVLA